MRIAHPLSAAQQSHFYLPTIAQVKHRTSIRTALAPSTVLLLSLTLTAERGVTSFRFLDVESRNIVTWLMMSCSSTLPHVS